MLNIFTTKQAADGIDIGDLKLDLSEYIKRTEAATKSEVKTLTEVVANKLDASPPHLHNISDVSELDKALASKYDTSKQYSYNVILSDSEKIPFLENPQVLSLECTTAKNSKGYKMYVDSGTNDLYIISPNNAIIGMYSVNSNKWIANVSDKEFSERVYIPASATKYIPQFVSSHSTPQFENIYDDDDGTCAYSAVLFTVTIRCTNCLENGYTFPKFNKVGKCLTGGIKTVRQFDVLNNSRKSWRVDDYCDIKFINESFTRYADPSSSYCLVVDSYEYTNDSLILNLRLKADYSDILNFAGTVNSNNVFVWDSEYMPVEGSYEMPDTITYSVDGRLKFDNLPNMDDIQSSITALRTEFEEYKNSVNAILLNHYEALRLLCSEHHISDTNHNDGAILTPSDPNDDGER